MDELERTEIEGRTKRWGEMVYGPIKMTAKAINEHVNKTAARWKQIADRNDPRS